MKMYFYIAAGDASMQTSEATNRDWSQKQRAYIIFKILSERSKWRVSRKLAFILLNLQALQLSAVASQLGTLLFGFDLKYLS